MSTVVLKLPFISNPMLANIPKVTKIEIFAQTYRVLIMNSPKP